MREYVCVYECMDVYECVCVLNILSWADKVLWQAMMYGKTVWRTAEMQTDTKWPRKKSLFLALCIICMYTHTSIYMSIYEMHDKRYVDCKKFYKHVLHEIDKYLKLCI